jgi:5'-nucleotidase
MTAHVLVSNDDGIFALGIQTLANTLAAAGYQVTVVCPDRERSGTSHSLTLQEPIRAEQVAGVFAPGIAAWACSGTPADCVKLALGALLEAPPDFVFSGINHGPNLGTDVLYSGTVAAAMEGTIEGIPSAAFSLDNFQAQDFQPAADFACTLLGQFQTQPWPGSTLLNVNIPAIPRAEIKGTKRTRQGLRRYVDTFDQRVDPKGNSYFWLAGEVLEEEIDPAEAHLPQTDTQGIKEQYITVTPLQYNLTDYPSLDGLSGIAF